MDRNVERHRMIKSELRKRGLTLADIAEDMGKSPTSISGCCLGRFYSKAIQEEVSLRINCVHTELFEERYNDKGEAIPQKNNQP